jgi:hypothetical protein
MIPAFALIGARLLSGVVGATASELKIDEGIGLIGSKKSDY